MEELNDGLKIYSEEVREVLADPPQSLLKWGNTIIFFFVAILILLSWVIQYPDLVTANITITSIVPPEKIIARTTGRFQNLLVTNEEIVKRGSPLAIIENSANYQDVFLLQKHIQLFEKSEFINFDSLQNLQLGGIEAAFAQFRSDYRNHQLNLDLKPYQVENEAQTSESKEIKSRIAILMQQKEINEKELLLQKAEVNRSEILFKKGVISTQELESKKLMVLQADKNYKNLLSTISQLQSSLIENKRNTKGTLITGTKEAVTLESNLKQSLFRLKKEIKDWELNFVLSASMDGTVSFLQIWNQNQNVNTGDQIFSILPNNTDDYIGKVVASAVNSGKIKEGQEVNIRLANYPDREFGMLVGKIKNISKTPNKEGNLLIDVSLPNQLKTSYNKTIPFQQEMIGTADIITQDLRLIERLLYDFRDIFKRS